MKLKQFNSTQAPQPAGGYAQAVEVQGAQRTLFISGQIPELMSGEVPADFKSQAKTVWSNLVAQLAAAEMSVANLAKVTIFLSDRSYATENGNVRREFLGAHSPALTVIVTDIFDERWLLEIEAVAVA
jgi:2-iminobutanoate/2-iminopropanoate deaminase